MEKALEVKEFMLITPETNIYFIIFWWYKHIEGGELRIWKKVNDTFEITNVIKPKPNSLVASLQSNSL